VCKPKSAEQCTEKNLHSYPCTEIHGVLGEHKPQYLHQNNKEIHHVKTILTACWTSE
jgi:hypothetical protein